jgi:hypothetical protein
VAESFWNGRLFYACRYCEYSSYGKRLRLADKLRDPLLSDGSLVHRRMLLRFRAVRQNSTPFNYGEGCQSKLSCLRVGQDLRLISSQLFYIAEYFYATSAAFIKISVAVALLRIAAARPLFKWALWGLIGATAIAALVFVVGIANICTWFRCERSTLPNTATGHPIGTLWGEANGTCNLQLNTDVSLFFSAIEILTDFSLSIMPAVLLWNIQMVRLDSMVCIHCDFAN